MSLTFPIPEMIFCNCTTGSIRLVMPDTSSVQTYVACKFYVRKINSNNNQIDIVGFNTSTKVYNISNTLSYQAAAIGTGCIVMLHSQAWYVNAL